MRPPPMRWLAVSAILAGAALLTVACNDSESSAPTPTPTVPATSSASPGATAPAAPSPTLPASPDASAIPLDQIYRGGKGRDDKIAVDGVSFVVDKGEIFGFLGPNGAGKTDFSGKQSGGRGLSVTMW